MKPSLVIIGLGNPGAAYALTRHNVGFWVVDALSQAYGEGKWKESGKFDALVQEARVGVAPVLLVKPNTFMNLSGDCARKLVAFYKLTPVHQVLVISDDIDLPVGTWRFREKGGPGTHNGMKSLVEALGEGFPRLRVGLGIAQSPADLATWVLSVPPAEEKALIDKAIGELPAFVKQYVLDTVTETA
jgi:PTH1 family peptidyl-tRNA hydrolase